MLGVSPGAREGVLLALLALEWGGLKKIRLFLNWKKLDCARAIFLSARAIFLREEKCGRAQSFIITHFVIVSRMLHLHVQLDLRTRPDLRALGTLRLQCVLFRGGWGGISCMWCSDPVCTPGFMRSKSCWSLSFYESCRVSVGTDCMHEFFFLSSTDKIDFNSLGHHRSLFGSSSSGCDSGTFALCFWSSHCNECRENALIC